MILPPQSEFRSISIIDAISAVPYLTLTLIAIASSLGPASCFGAQNASEESKLLKEIVKDWRSREKSVESLQITWTEERIQMKGTQLPPEITTPETNGLFPPEDYRFEVKWTAKLDGDRFYYHMDGPVWDQVKGEYSDSFRTFCFDGREGRYLYGTVTAIENRGQNKVAGAVRPIGYMRTLEQSDHYYRNFHFQPVMDAYRPLMRPFSVFRPNEWNVSSADALIGDDRCVILQWSPGGQVGRYEYWVDREKRSLVRRVRRYSENGRLILGIDVDYETDAREIWIPRTWRISDNFESGKPRLACLSKVTDVSFAPKWSNDDFKLEFPKGTRVRDSTSGSSEIKEYVIQDSGKWREILPKEETALYRTLMTTKTGEATFAPTPSKFRTSRFLIACGFLVLLILVAIAVRKRNQ